MVALVDQNTCSLSNIQLVPRFSPQTKNFKLHREEKLAQQVRDQKSSQSHSQEYSSDRVSRQDHRQDS